MAKSDKKVLLFLKIITFFLFSDYYPHAYQITNILRGKALLVFTDDQEQEIYEYFDPIYMLWESKKHLFNVERSNFMYNALVLQIIFMILRYPPRVIRIFNMIKGESNLRFYESIIKVKFSIISPF